MRINNISKPEIIKAIKNKEVEIIDVLSNNGMRRNKFTIIATGELIERLFGKEVEEEENGNKGGEGINRKRKERERQGGIIGNQRNIQSKVKEKK